MKTWFNPAHSLDGAERVCLHFGHHWLGLPEPGRSAEMRS